MDKYKPPASKNKYVVPKERVADPLAPENFPSFGGAAARPSVSLNFKSCVTKVLPSEDKHNSIYNPDGITPKQKLKLEKDGWAVLSVSDIRKGGVASWNERQVAPTLINEDIPDVECAPGELKNIPYIVDGLYDDECGESVCDDEPNS